MAARKFVSLSVTMTGVLRTKFLCLLGVLFTKLFFPLLCARWLFYLTIIFASLFRRAWWVFYFRNCVSRSFSMVVLSPEGSCECRSRMGSNWFLLCFNYSELCSRNVLGCFKMRLIIRLLKILKMLYCDGWMDGLVGGDFLPPWIFFIFKYNKKQNELLPKLCVKIAFAY